MGDEISLGLETRSLSGAQDHDAAIVEVDSSHVVVAGRQRQGHESAPASPFPDCGPGTPEDLVCETPPEICQ